MQRRVHRAAHLQSLPTRAAALLTCRATSARTASATAMDGITALSLPVLGCRNGLLLLPVHERQYVASLRAVSVQPAVAAVAAQTQHTDSDRQASANQSVQQPDAPHCLSLLRCVRCCVLLLRLLLGERWQHSGPLHVLRLLDVLQARTLDGAVQSGRVRK